MNFEEVLKKFKDSESPECIVPLLDDNKLRMALVAWQMVKVTRKPSTECSTTDISEMWAWLWEQISYDEQSYAIIAGAPIHEIYNTFLRLKGMRLVYPDGTICLYAKQFLQGLIMARLPKRSKRKEDDNGE
jgi:hypothetical protein